MGRVGRWGRSAAGTNIVTLTLLSSASLNSGFKVLENYFSMLILQFVFYLFIFLFVLRVSPRPETWRPKEISAPVCTIRIGGV